MSSSPYHQGQDALIEPNVKSTRQQGISSYLSPDDKAAFKNLLIGLAIITVCRLVVAFALPLTEDEAYYRIWAQSLLFGYYDHPPMIGWWIWFGQLLVEDVSLGVRLLACIASALTSLSLYFLGVELGFERRTARLAAWLLQAMPVITLGSILAIPDVALLMFWTMSVTAAVRAVKLHAPVWWVAAGIFAGLATLSKYSGLFLGPGFFLWLLLDQQRRSHLFSPWPWIAAIVALLIFGLNVHWNAMNDWITINKQFGRIEPKVFSPQHLLEFAGAQFVLLNPALVIALGVYTVSALRKPQDGDFGGFHPMLIGLPFFAYLFVHAFHSKVQAHWPTSAYSTIALTAAWVIHRRPDWGLGQAMKIAAAWIAISLAAVALFITAFPQSVGRNHPSEQLLGWKELAIDLQAEAEKRDALWIGSISYAVNAMLANQRVVTYPTVHIDERARYPANDVSWSVDLNQPGLVIDLGRRFRSRELSICFHNVESLGEIDRVSPSGRTKTYELYLVSGAKLDILNENCWTQAYKDEKDGRGN